MKIQRNQTKTLVVYFPFSVSQYLGLVEVEESRGMHVCEEAVKKLKVVSIQCALGGVIESLRERKMLFFFYQLLVVFDFEKDF